MFNAIDKLAYLSKVATQNEELRLKDLYKIVQRPEFLQYVYAQIAGNSGAKTAGIDKETKFDLEKDDEKFEKTIIELGTKLWNQSYQPLPVRRVEIPKANNKGKRPLGIPTLKDRIVQSAVKMILEAIYEPMFLDTSHGFRPHRSCQTAVNTIVSRTFDWAVEGDIKGCFDNIKHGRLLDLLRKRIADEKFIQLINKFLKNGYQMGYGTDGKQSIFQTETGTPQGGILSPVLANIYLHEFDKHIQKKLRNVNKKVINTSRGTEYNLYSQQMTKIQNGIDKGVYPFKWGEFIQKTVEELAKSKNKSLRKRVFTNFENKEQAVAKILEIKKKREKVPFMDRKKYFNEPELKSFGYVRYADDFVILLGKYTKEDAEKLKDEITKWFDEELGLTLSPEKTKITHSTKGFRFLGYDIYHHPSKDGLGYEHNFARVYTPKEIVDSVLDKIDIILRKYHNANFYDLIVALNRVIGGWSRYHLIANGWTKTANKLDHLVFWKIMHWLGRKHKSSIAKIMPKFYAKSQQGTHKTIFTISGDEAKKRVELLRFSDFKYTNPSEVASNIRKGEEKENWHQSDNDESAIQEILGKVRSGTSAATYVEKVALVGDKCENCGSTDEKLEMHHVRMVKRSRRKQFNDVINSSRDIPTKLLCETCRTRITTEQKKARSKAKRDSKQLNR